jgi:hypothetical protein
MVSTLQAAWNQNVLRVLYRCLGTLGAFVLVAVAGLGTGAPVAAQTPPAGTTHSVSLTWVAPSPVGGSGTVAWYNVYKSVAGAAFGKINSAVISGLATVDGAVTSGQSLSYCATTVDSKGEESACSVPVATVVPTNPNPPTLSLTVN